MTKQAYLQGSGGRGLGYEIGMRSGKMAGRLHGQYYTELDRQLQRKNGDSVIVSVFFLMPWNGRGSRTIRDNMS